MSSLKDFSAVCPVCRRPLTMREDVKSDSTTHVIWHGRCPSGHNLDLQASKDNTPKAFLFPKEFVSISIKNSKLSRK